MEIDIGFLLLYSHQLWFYRCSIMIKTLHLLSKIRLSIGIQYEGCFFPLKWWTIACLLTTAGRKGSEPGRNGKHWFICASGIHYINGSMPRISTEWKEATRWLVGGGASRLAFRREWNGSQSWKSYKTSSTLSSLWCCGTRALGLCFFCVLVKCLNLGPLLEFGITFICKGPKDNMKTTNHHKLLILSLTLVPKWWNNMQENELDCH